MAGPLIAHFSSLAQIDTVDKNTKVSNYLLNLTNIRSLMQDDLKNIFLLLPTI